MNLLHILRILNHKLIMLLIKFNLKDYILKGFKIKIIQHLLTKCLKDSLNYVFVSLILMRLKFIHTIK